jgi:hypothetical protein
MRRRTHLLACLVLGAIWVALGANAGAAERTYHEKSLDGGELRYEGSVPVLHLQGQPAGMGRQQAMLATEKVRPLLSVPRQLLHDQGVGLPGR